jgi:hypothetical protein
MSDSRHDTREFPVHHGKWPAHDRGAGLLSRPEHAEAVAADAGDGEQAEPKKAAAPRPARGKAAKDAPGE